MNFKTATNTELIDIATDIMVLLKSLEAVPDDFHLLRKVCKDELSEIGINDNLATVEDMELAGGVSE